VSGDTGGRAPHVLPRCGSCGLRSESVCPTCSSCEYCCDCELDDDFDADELGIDPEEKQDYE
jgi:hypothetical protein